MNAQGHSAEHHIDWIARFKQLRLKVRNFVSGQWQDQEGGVLIEKYAPRDGRLLCRFSAGSMSDVDQSIGVAKESFEDGRWARLPTERRKEVLLKLASLVEANREELALLESLDVGKPIHEALTFDVPEAAARLRFCAEAIDKLGGTVYGADASSLSYQLTRPAGTVAGIVGWNFPLVLAASKAAPALAAGNSLVLKPSELTSLSTGRLAELAVTAGVPQGVFNVIHGGPALGEALAHHKDVDLVTFTGSSQTGRKLLMAAGASNMKRQILECGGKAADIVFNDCPDLDAVAERVVARAFWNQGQVCTASSRLIVQRGVKDELQRRIIDKTALLIAGDPLEPKTSFGALVSEGHLQKVRGYIEGGAQEGARMVYKSDCRPPLQGGFYSPAVIFDRVSPEQKLAREEIFGPVLAILEFGDECEAVSIANNTIYGLSAIVWTKDLGRAHRVAQGVRAGWIVINATATPTGGPGPGVLPVGGHKQSGIGVEGGLEGLVSYMAQSSVQVYV